MIATWSSKDEDIYEAADNTSGKLLSNIKDETDSIAIRICTNDALPIAFAYSDVHILFSALERNDLNYRYLNKQKGKIFLLKQTDDCKLNTNEKYLTEFWVVPANTEFPEFTEIRNVSDLTINRMDFDDQKQTWKLNDAKNKLLKILSEDRTTLILFQLLNSNKLERKIDSRAYEIRNFLIRNGIGKHRIFIKKNLDYYPEDFQYPRIYKIH